MEGHVELAPGTSLGKYEIVRKLAVGGMAEIYLARIRGTAGFEKLVVLKRILPSLSEDRKFVEMFLDEARLAAALEHPNIASVFDVGMVGATYYYAMELVHGQDVRAIRVACYERDRDLPLAIVLAMVIGTASALAYAHTRSGAEGPLGIVHRDVSPSNILISYDGAVKLVDFGIARAANRTAGKTRTGTLKGKVPYMSPEQCRGKVLDGRSDLFSLGTVLYELTTCYRPFEGRSEYDTLEMIVLGKAQPPSTRVESYPPDLEAIVMCLLARDPADRYQAAGEVVTALETFASRHGLVLSDRVLSRYMRQLFADEIVEWERSIGAAPVVPGLSLELDPLDEPPESSPATDPWKPLLVTTGVKVYLKTPSPAVPPDTGPKIDPFADDLPTTAIRRAAETMPRAASPEVPQPSDRTDFDTVLPFDPILARAVDLLDEIDSAAPRGEAPSMRALRRVTALIPRAGRFLATGKLEQAMAAAELALGEPDGDEEVVLALVRGQPILMTIFETVLGDRSRHVDLGRPLTELAELDLAPRIAFLISRVDGRTTIEDLIVTSGLKRFEACRTLARMVMRRLIIVR